ncbi:MAG: TatD family hydrolase [bacterium]
MILFDTHVHLSKGDVEKTLKEANENGVEKVILAGTNLKNSFENIEIAKVHKNVYAAIGVYPHDETDKTLEEIFKSLWDLIIPLPKSAKSKLFSPKKLPTIVAIGECGLDYKENKRSVDEQKELFRMQIGLSCEKDLPLLIHSRNSYKDTLLELKRYKDTKKLKGVFHCFVGDLKTASEIIEMGFYISFTGVVTYPSARYLENVIKGIPFDRILLETDSPFLVPEPLRSEGIKKNTPKNVKIIAQKIAEIKNVSITEVAKVTTENAEKLFLTT